MAANRQSYFVIPAEPWIPFVGAGISYDSGLPLARAFSHVLVSALRKRLSRTLGMRLKGRLAARARGLETIRMEVLLQEAHDATGARSLLSPDSMVFDPWFSAKPNAYHQFLALRLRTSGTPAVFTTNVDNLIEEAYRNTEPSRAIGPTRRTWHKELSVVASLDAFAKFDFQQWKAKPYPVLFKLHGSLGEDLQHKTLETIQVSVRQLAQVASLGPKADVIDLFTREWAFLFAGYSGRDDFDLFPLLLQCRGRQPWVWLEHVAEGLHHTVDYPHHALRDPVDALLSANPTQSPSALPPCARVFGQTDLLLGIRVKAEQDRERVAANAENAVTDWVNGLEPRPCIRLLVGVLQHQGHHNLVVDILRAAGRAATTDPDLILARMRSLKDRDREPNSLNELVACGQALAKLRGVCRRQMADADSLVAFAYRDRHEYLAAALRFHQAERAVLQLPKTDPTWLRTEREMIWAYRSLWQLSLHAQETCFPITVEGRRIRSLRALQNIVQKCYGCWPRSERDAFKAARKFFVQKLRRVIAKRSLAPPAEREYECAKAWIDLAWLLKDMDDLTSAIEAVRNASAAASHCGDARLQARIDRDLAWFLWDRGCLTAAVETAKRSRWLTAGLEDRLDRVGAHRNVGFLLSYAGEPDEAEAEFRSALSLLDRDRSSRDRREIIETFFARGESRLKGRGLIAEGIEDLVSGCLMLPEFKGRTISRIRVELVEARKRHYERVPVELQKRMDEALERSRGC